MSNSNSENPDSLETPNSAANEEKLSTSDRSATVVEMSGSTRAADASAVDANEGEASPAHHDSGEESPRNAPREQKASRKLWIVLLVLLLISVAINVMQAQQRQRAAVQAGEIELALDRAMERIDAETFRANSAEGTISAIDQNVDNVQERIADLQSALSKLSEATAR